MTNPSRAPVLDATEALLQFDNDTAFYASLLQDFMEALPELLAQARQALEAGQLAQAAIPLHTIKGMTLALGAKALTEFAQEQERRCKQADAALDAAAVSAALTALAGETVATMARWQTDAGLAPA